MSSPLIVGNWKMNGTGAALPEIARVAAAGGDTLWIAPPFTLIERAVGVAAGRIRIGGQDCHHAIAGAHTGCISAVMLVDAGARFVILGHSERRADNFETDADIRAKSVAAQAAGLHAIICVGETEAQRDAGRGPGVVGAQIAAALPDSLGGITIAYEPVWAIGTGRTPAPQEVAAMHGFIRSQLELGFGPQGTTTRILYGGSVKPENAALLLCQSNVGGALVGGASLTAASFLAIAAAAGA